MAEWPRNDLTGWSGRISSAYQPMPYQISNLKVTTTTTGGNGIYVGAGGKKREPGVREEALAWLRRRVEEVTREVPWAA